MNRSQNTFMEFRKKSIQSLNQEHLNKSLQITQRLPYEHAALEDIQILAAELEGMSMRKSFLNGRNSQTNLIRQHKPLSQRQPKTPNGNKTIFRLNDLRDNQSFYNSSGKNFCKKSFIDEIEERSLQDEDEFSPDIKSSCEQLLQKIKKKQSGKPKIQKVSYLKKKQFREQDKIPKETDKLSNQQENRKKKQIQSIKVVLKQKAPIYSTNIKPIKQTKQFEKQKQFKPYIAHKKENGVKIEKEIKLKIRQGSQTDISRTTVLEDFHGCQTSIQNQTKIFVLQKLGKLQLAIKKQNITKQQLRELNRMIEKMEVILRKSHS